MYGASAPTNKGQVMAQRKNAPPHSVCDDCDKICMYHAEHEKTNENQDKRLEKLEEVVNDAIPRMQGRVNLLIQIFVAGLILLISISGFSFLQLVDFKKQYAKDKQDIWERTLDSERRYVDLINSLGQKVTKLEGYHEPKYFIPDDNND